MGEKGNGGTDTAEDEGRVNSELDNASGGQGGPEDQSTAVNTSRSNIKNN